ncbi:MAG: Mur ligase family protein [Spirochaetota bacterium]|nr:Mur ligase family protein [Spirochaetota bacterium]
MKSIAERLNILTDNEKTGYLQYLNYSLKNMEYLCKHYGNPHNKLKIVHIAGTNGKGSVAYMLNSILISAGYRVGLYLSPHLSRINERIKINNIEISSKRLHEYIDELYKLLSTMKDIQPTYFDVLTLFAFRYFSEEEIDIAIIEAGLGGRLDSTNIVSPLISIITDIFLDHKSILGNTLKKITQEKAGIIKPNSIVITSNKKKDILDIIIKKSIESCSRLYVLNKDFQVKRIRELVGKGFTYDLSSINDTHINDGNPLNLYIKDIELKIPSKFQITNSTLSIATSHLLKEFGFKIEESNIIDGIKRVRIPGRFHIISKKPLIIFDPAHNPAALKTIINTINKNYQDKQIMIILSIMQDKDYSIILKLLFKNLSNKIYYFELNDERCLKISEEKIHKQNSLYHDIQVFKNSLDLTKALRNDITADSLLLFTGTFRLFDLAKKVTSTLQDTHP